MTQRLGDSYKALYHQNVRWNQESALFGLSATELVFKGEPICYEILDTTRGLPGLFEEAKATDLRKHLVNPGWIDWLKAHNFFSLNIGGTTLSQIEKIPLPLSPASVARIDGLFLDSLLQKAPILRSFFSPPEKITYMRQLLTALATRSVLDKGRGERDAVPRGLKDLRDVMVGYFDFYTKEVIKPVVGEEEDRWLMLQLTWHMPRLRDALGCYIPARLGITPSSATELYQARAENSSPYSMVWRGIASFRVGLAELLSQASRGAYLDALPADLQKYQHHHGQNNQAVLTKVEEYRRGLGWDSYQRTQLHFQAKEDLSALHRYHPTLIRDISKGKGRLMMSLSPEELVSSVTVTCVNPSVLMFILRLGNSSEMMLEVDPDGNELDGTSQIYGIPAKLLRGDPYVADLLFGRVLPKILEVVKSHHPEIEPPPLPIRVEPILPSRETVSLVQAEERERETRLGRVERILPRPAKVAVGAIMPSKAPRNIVPFRPVREVVYSREQIVDSVGKKIPEKEVRRMEEAIRKFEFRQVRAKSVKVSDDLIELRVGHFRVFLEPQNNGCFSLHHVLRRDKMDKPRWEQRYLAD